MGGGGLRLYAVVVEVEDGRQPSTSEAVLSYLQHRMPAGSAVSVLSSEEMLKPELTEKQMQVLKLSDKGLTAAEIAEKLGVTASNVNKHLNVLRAKFGVEKARQLGRAARDRGVL